MRFFQLSISTILFLHLLGTLPASADQRRHARPNVIVILADDLAWGDLSLHGNRNLATPQIDSLARDGASFKNFYVCTVCAPTRAEFLTGRYHPRTGVTGILSGQERINLDERTLADAFRAAGYRTGIFGKWHNGGQWPYHPNARGFEEFYGFTAGHWPEYFDPLLEHNGEIQRAHGYIADLFADRALAFIEQHRTEPFFCYLAFNTPHTPIAVSPEEWKRFKNKTLTLLARSETAEDLDVTRGCLAMVENMDRNVGVVLQKLADLGLAENTIVVFFSDNGPASFRWNGDLKGRKGSLDEGGLRSPLFIRWPGKIQPSLVVQPIAGAIDLLPTLCALTGTDLPGPKALDGEDLSPLLLGQSRTWPERFIFSYRRKDMVRVRSTRYLRDPDGALFDLQSDPCQRNDIAAAQPEIAAQLAEAARTWQLDNVTAAPPSDRPFTVGYPAFPLTRLTAGEARLKGEINYSAVISNSCFLTNWKTTADTVSWDIEVHAEGDYEVTLYYTCPKEKTGSRIELSFLAARLASQLTAAWDPPLYTNQDTVPRQQIISPMKEFRPLNLGTIRLPAGRGLLTLRATEIPNGVVADLLQIELRLKP